MLHDPDFPRLPAAATEFATLRTKAQGERWQHRTSSRKGRAGGCGDDDAAAEDDAGRL